ncbi:MAG: hypothetical protein K8823_470 [Cenarchaeum symbiont of Oopsacas minuta]|nr:hypothetical protein [Cenarchaeum symbiont of Oopsacas minuta]
MFGSKPELEEGQYVFATVGDKKYRDFVIGAVTGIENEKIGVNGILVKPVGLKNKVEQNKAGPRSDEILTNPTSENCIFSLIYRIEHENFTGILDEKDNRIEHIPPSTYAILDGWIRESLPDLINTVLSLSAGDDRDKAKSILRNKMESLHNKRLRRNLYSVCRSLKILN